MSAQTGSDANVCSTEVPSELTDEAISGDAALFKSNIQIRRG
jgi:hypothetical protein